MVDPASQSTGSRVAYLDGAKAIGMFLVFFGHTVERLPGDPAASLMKLTYSFHMPLFFFLAGIFAKPGSLPLGQLLKTKVFTRLLPVLFFTLVALPFWIQSSSWEMPWARASGYLSGQPSLNWPTWFLVCLFSLEMITGTVGRWFPLDSTRNKTVSVGVAFALGIGTIHFTPAIGAFLGLPDNFWFVLEAIAASPFYLLGNRLRNQAIRPRDTKTDLSILLVSAVVLLTTFQLNQGPFRRPPDVVMMIGGSHGNPFAFYLTGCAGIVVVLSACRLIYRDFAPARFIGTNTLIYLGFAGISMHFIDGIALRALPAADRGWVATLAIASAYSIGIMACFAPSVFAIRRWIPWAVGLKK